MIHSSFTVHVLWLFGLSGSGKSTLADNLAAELRNENVPVLRLDGDEVRAGLCASLGFSTSDRSENIRRSAEVAKLGLRSRLCVIASFITPMELHREQVRSIVGGDALSFVFLDAPLSICQSRDVKGLYAKEAAGVLGCMTGVSSAFEIPVTPDLILHTGTEELGLCAAKLLGFAWQRLSLAKLS